MRSDVAGFYEHLQATTATLLGYDDIDQLSPAQQIRLERAIALRLVIDDAQARQMRGETIGTKAFVDASESLERMLGSNPDAVVTERFNPDHQRRLRELVERTVMAGAEQDARDERLLGLFHKIVERGGSAEALRAEFEALLAETLPVTVIAPAAAAPPSEPAPQTSSQPPLARPDAPIPPSYLRDGQRREEWYDGGVGNVTWFRPHG